MQLKIMSTEECKRKKIDPNMLNRRDQLGDCLQCIEFSKMKHIEILVMHSQEKSFNGC